MLTKLLTDTYLKIWVKGNPLSKVGHSLVIIHISLFIIIPTKKRCEINQFEFGSHNHCFGR